MNNKVPGSIMSLNQRAGVLPAKRLVSNIFLKTIQNQSWNSKTFSAFDFYCSYLRYSFLSFPILKSDICPTAGTAPMVLTADSVGHLRP